MRQLLNCCPPYDEGVAGALLPSGLHATRRINFPKDTSKTERITLEAAMCPKHTPHPSPTSASEVRTH